ncbi:MAG TPA: hypothetical protein VMC43_03035 [Candidatus Paceibacterota bacterium]|nr:hypothetical protein [Candidatus Paceibacterota bacterium]
MPHRPKVLVVESGLEYQRLCEEAGLGKKAKLFFASTLAEAHQLFNEHRANLALILVAALMEKSEQPNTVPFVLACRERGFAGPIIAWSNAPGYRQPLVAAGCTHEADKLAGPTLVLKLLGLS